MNKFLIIATAFVLAVPGLIVAAFALALAAVSTPPANAVEAKWDCNTRSGTTSCMWQDCGVSTSAEPGKLTLWATGSGDLKGVFHLLLLSDGQKVAEQWTNTAAGNKPVPESSKVDIFERECAQDHKLESLPPEIQLQFRGKYGASTFLVPPVTAPGPAPGAQAEDG
jgi:hypothetical protein